MHRNGFGDHLCSVTHHRLLNRIVVQSASCDLRSDLSYDPPTSGRRASVIIVETNDAVMCPYDPPCEPGLISYFYSIMTVFEKKLLLEVHRYIFSLKKLYRIISGACVARTILLKETQLRIGEMNTRRTAVYGFSG